MKAADVRKQIKAGDTAPLYLLEGDDLQARHDLALEFAELVDEGLQAFNLQSFHANEATTTAMREQMIADLLTTARTLPMMSPRRVVLVQEAERLLSPRKAKDEDAPPPEPDRKRKRALSANEDLEAYIESPEPMTTMVFVAGNLDANRRLVKLLRKHAISVNCGALGGPAEAAAWMQKRLEKDGLTIEPRAVKLVLASTGLSLGRIRAEIDKLALYASGEKVITARHVNDVILPQIETGEEFALMRAIGYGNAAAALREVAALIDTGMPPFMVLGQIRVATGRLKPDSRAKSGLDAVFETDIAIKSSIGEPRHLLERLVIQLCVAR